MDKNREKVYELALFQVNNASTQYRNLTNIVANGIDDFVKQYEHYEKAGLISWRHFSDAKAKTDNGIINELKRLSNARRFDEVKFVKKDFDDYTLIFFELPRNTWCYSSNTDPKICKTYKAYKVRYMLPQEIERRELHKAEQDLRTKTFDFNKVIFKTNAKVEVTRYDNKGITTNVDGFHQEDFDSVEEAKAFIDKYIKAWKMQMTLHGHANDIVHDATNTLTVFKKNCNMKYLSRLSFSISPKTFYDWPTMAVNS